MIKKITLVLSIGLALFSCKEKEAFWFAFPVGSIGGLLFSLIGVLIYLPLFIVKKRA